MLIDLKNVSLWQEDQEILHNINFHVDNNDFIYIIGKVGSGKSSLLKALFGELPIKDGEARVLDFDLRKLKNKHIPMLRRQLGIVFQDFQLLHEWTIEKNLDFVLKATEWKKKQRPDRINEVLELVGLKEKAYHFPHELSGGEQQRVCIARALLNNPKIILADEPTANLDPETCKKVMNILQNIREQGTAVIMVTHNPYLLKDYPGIVYRCENGTLTECV